MKKIIFKYPSDIFVDNGKGKKIQAIMIVLSLIFHLFFIYLILNLDNTKRNKIKKSTKIISLKIAPLIVPNIDKKITKKQINNKKYFNNIAKYKQKLGKELQKSINKLSLKKNITKINLISKSNDFDYLKERKKTDKIDLKSHDKLFNDPYKLLQQKSEHSNGQESITSASSINNENSFSNKKFDNNIENYGGTAFKKRKGFDIIPWASKIIAKVNDFWKIPHNFNYKEKGEVGVSVVFDKTGKIKSVDLIRSADTQVFNQAAINAFNIGNPFYPLPKEVILNKLKLYFVFNYNPTIETKKQNNHYSKSGAITNVNPIIKSIGLIKDASFDKTNIPNNLYLGIESAKRVFYKISYKDKTLSVGQFNIGSNSVKITSKGIFSKNHTYEYFLDIMNNGHKYRNKFYLDVEYNLLDNSGKTDNKIGKSGFGVAMFIENQLIVYHKKSVHISSISRNEKIMKNQNTNMSTARNPLDVINGNDYKKLSVPMMDKLVLGYKKLIKPIFKKKKKYRRFPTYKKLNRIFERIDAEGLVQPIEITLALRDK